MKIHIKLNHRWWVALSEREQYFLLAGGLFLAVALFYFALYAPLSQAVVGKRTEIEDKKNTLALFVQAEPLLKNQSQNKPIQSSDYLTVLSQQLNDKKFQSFVFQLQQTADNHIQLTFDAVPYVLWMDFLWQQMATYHVTIKQWEVTQTKTPGLVQARVILSVQ